MGAKLTFGGIAMRSSITTILAVCVSACGLSTTNEISVSQAGKGMAAANCEIRGRCVKDPHGLAWYNPSFVTATSVVKRGYSNQTLIKTASLADDLTFISLSQKLAPLVNGVVLVAESETCDSHKNIVGSILKVDQIYRFSEGRYKACIAYVGEGLQTRVYTLPPITIDLTPPVVSLKQVEVSNIKYESASISWSKASDNTTPENGLSYVVYFSKSTPLLTLEDIHRYATAVPGSFQSVTSTQMNNLTERTSYQIAVAVQDEAGNESFVGQTSFSTPPMDQTPPSSPSIDINSGAAYIASTSSSLSLSAGDATDMYITNTAGCASGGAWEAYASSKSWTIAQTNSTATVYVKFRDSVGNETACVSDSIIHDDIMPVSPVIADASKSFNASFSTTIQQGVPADANFKEFRYTTNSLDPTCSTGTASSALPTSVAIPAQTTTLKVITCDQVGLASPVTSSTYTYDTTVPTVVLTTTAPSVTNVSPIPVTITFSKSVTGFTVSGITVVNGTKSGFSGSGASYTVNVIPTADGIVTVGVAAGVAQDAATNPNQAATQLSRTYDTTPPPAPTIVSVSDFFKNTLDFSFAQSTAVSDFRDFRYLLNDTVSILNCGTGQTASSSNTFRINVTSSVRVIACDQGGLASTESAKTLTLDQIPPALTLSQTDIFSKLNTVTFAGSCESGLSVVIFEGASQVGSVSCTSAAWTWTTPSRTSDGVYTFTIKQTDLATNETSLTATFTRDNQAPSFTLGVGQNLVQKTNTNTVTWSGTCETGLSIVATKNGSSISSPACSSGAWSFSDTSALDGTINYIFSQTDKAGNSASLSLQWQKDSNVPALALNSGQNASVTSTNNTQTWSGTCQPNISSISVSGSQTTTISCTSGAWTFTTSSVTTDGQRSYTLTQTNTLSQSATLSLSWTRDATLPLISSFQLNNNAATANGKVVNVNLAASDATTNILKFCLRVFNASQASPTPTDDCWVNVDAPFPGLSPGLNLNLTNYPQFLDFFDGNYYIYAWVKDASGNSSAVSTQTIQLAQAQPPSILGFFGTSDDLSYPPLAAGKETVALNNTVFIKWKIQDDKAWPSGAVKIFATSDDATWTELSSAGGIDAIAASGCTAGSTYTGCFAWQNIYYSGYFRLKIEITDSEGLKTNSLSNALNTGAFTILAGNVSTGIDGDAKRAVFFSDSSIDTNANSPNRFVVARNGDIYISDHTRGVLKIDAKTGVMSVFVKKATTYSGDGGPASNASVKYPWKIAIDSKDRLIIWDFDRIRRIVTKSPTPVITTIIGYINSNLPANDPFNQPLWAYDAWWPRSKSFPLVVAPNDDIYFVSSSPNWDPGVRQIRVYRSNLSTPVVDTITLSGTGNSSDLPDAILNNCGIVNFGFRFDASGQLQRIHATSHSEKSDARYQSSDCGYPAGISYYYFPIMFDSTGAKINSYPNLDNIVFKDNWVNDTVWWYTSMKGELYAASRYASRIWKYNENPTGSETNLKLLAGVPSASAFPGNAGFSADGTPAVGAQSKLDIISIFVDQNERVYFMDNQSIRVLASDNTIRTLYAGRINSGNTEPAAQSRYEFIGSVDYYKDSNNITKIYALDNSANRVHEITPQGNSVNIAGNGFLNRDASLSIPAYSSPAGIDGWGTKSNAVIDQSTGKMYFVQTGWYIALLDLTKDISVRKWERVIGGGATPLEQADGMIGTNNTLLQSDSPSSLIYNSFLPGILGFGDGKLAVVSYLWNNILWKPHSTLLKVYSTSEGYKQTHLAGVVNSANTTTWVGNFYSQTTCASGTNAASCTKLPFIGGSPGYNNYIGYVKSFYDSIDHKWWTGSQGQTYVFSIGEGSSGVITQESLKSGITSFAYRRNGTTEFIYYCGDADGRIYKHTVGQAASTDTALPWPIASMRCQGNGMVFDPNRLRIIFPFTANGLSGVAETDQL